jgi:hypothetical protein
MLILILFLLGDLLNYCFIVDFEGVFINYLFGVNFFIGVYGCLCVGVGIFEVLFKILEDFKLLLL